MQFRASNRSFQSFINILHEARIKNLYVTLINVSSLSAPLIILSFAKLLIKYVDLDIFFHVDEFFFSGTAYRRTS